MKKICVDSSVLFLVLAGRLDGGVFAEYDQVVVPSVVVGEFLCGIDESTRKGLDQRRVFNEFAAADAVYLAPVSSVTADYFGRIFRFLKQKGCPIPTNDMWIAAVAMEHGAELISMDAHFKKIPFLRLRE